MNALTQSSATIIAAYLDAVIRKDASAVDRYFDPDVEYMVNGSPSGDPAGVLPPISVACHSALPWLGLYHGREALKGFLAHMHRNLEVTAFGPREVISEGNKAAAFGWFRLRALSTGRTIDISYSILFELRAGLISRYHFVESMEGVVLYLNGGDDLSPVLARVEKAGGKVLLKKTFLSKEAGHIAYFADTEGNKIGLHSMS